MADLRESAEDRLNINIAEGSLQVNRNYGININPTSVLTFCGPSDIVHCKN
jgi:hypothetical protein